MLQRAVILLQDLIKDLIKETGRDAFNTSRPVSFEVVISARCELYCPLRFGFLPAFFQGFLGLFVSPAFDLAQFNRQFVSGGGFG